MSELVAFAPMQTALSRDELRLQKQLTEFVERLARESQPFSDNSEAACRARFDRCKGSIEQFGRTYTPHYFTHPSAVYHADLDAILLGKASSETHIFPVHGPRHHAKSTRARVGLMQRVLFGTVRYPLIVSEQLYLARAHADYILADLLGNRKIAGDFSIDILKQDAQEGVVRLRITPRATGRAHLLQIDCASYGRSVKGRIFMQWRPDFCLIDDFEATKTSRNPAIGREKANWVKQEVYPAVDDAPILWLGNTGSDASALYHIFLDVAGSKSKEELRTWLQEGSVPGAIALPAGMIGEEELGLPNPPRKRGSESRSNGLDPEAVDKADEAGGGTSRTPSDGSGDDLDAEVRPDITPLCYRADRMAVNEDGEVVTEYLWPTKYVPDWYARRRATMGPFIYESEMNGAPIREGEFFKREWFEDVFYDELPDEEELTWFTWLDAAFGQSGKGAHKAIPICATDGTAYYVVDCYCRNDEDLARALDWWAQAFRRFPGLLHGRYENDFGQENRLAPLIADAEERNGFPLPVSGDSNKRGSKEARIESMEPLASTGRIRFPSKRNTDLDTLFAQMLAYPNGNVDGPDALESCLVRLRRGAAGSLEYTSLGGRRYERSGRRHNRRR